MGKLPRKRRVPNFKTSRPHVKRTIVPGGLDIGGGDTVEGNLPVVLLTVETDTARRRHDFDSCCKRLTVSAYIAERLGWNPPLLHAHRTVYECVGAPQALYDLIMQCPAVVDWQYAFSATVGGQATGSGPEKIRPSGKPSKPSKAQSGSYSESIPRDSQETTTAYLVNTGVVR